MAEESKIERIASEPKTRRSAIRTAAQVAVTAPAVGLLLSAGTKTAQAYSRVCTQDQAAGFTDANVTSLCTTADDLSIGANGGFVSDDATFIGDDLVSF